MRPAVEETFHPGDYARFAPGYFEDWGNSKDRINKCYRRCIFVVMDRLHSPFFPDNDLLVLKTMYCSKPNILPDLITRAPRDLELVSHEEVDEILNALLEVDV
ncbi:MAG: hypothetical protein V2A74_14975 [bacterium]